MQKIRRLISVAVLTCIASWTPVLSGTEIRPFKPYVPLKDLSFSDNLKSQADSLSMSFSENTFLNRCILPASMLATSLVYNDNILDRSIVVAGSTVQPSLHPADYFQYLPYVMALTLKLSGAESRSDWPRFITSSLFAFGNVAIATNVLKYTVRRQRPGGREYNSFHSGHTATAFMNATILHREYGETLGPWVSVCSYGLATATGFMRVISNRHWLSDMICGAGIGIFSTELSYQASSALFKDRYLTKREKWTGFEERPEWDFGILSYGSIKSHTLANGTNGGDRLEQAYTVGIAASYIPQYIGPCIFAGFTQIYWNGPDRIILPERGEVPDIPFYSVGVRSRIPLSGNMELDSQALAGFSKTDRQYSFEYSDGSTLSWGPHSSARFMATIGLDIRTSTCTGISAFTGIDYYHTVWRTWTAGTKFSLVF